MFKFNYDILRFIQSFSNTYLSYFAILCTMMGEEYFYSVILTYIFWCKNKEIGYKLGFSFLSNGIINNAVKDIFKVKRPIGTKGIFSMRTETATGYSFPSGHSQGAASFWSSLMLILKKKCIYVIGTIIIILVGLSRLYLGVHWPTDVIFGIIFGVAWTFFAIYIYDKAMKTNKQILLVILPFIALLGLFIFKSNDYIKSLGIFIGFFCGFFIERKYINFNTKASLPVQIVKMISGISVLLLIRIYLKKLFPIGNLWDFIRYAILGLWVTCGAPVIFEKVRLLVKHKVK